MLCLKWMPVNSISWDVQAGSFVLVVAHHGQPDERCVAALLGGLDAGLTSLAKAFLLSTGEALSQSVTRINPGLY